MSYSVELYFDQKSENTIKNYLEIINKEGIDNLFYNLKSLPHISLAVYNDNINHLELIKYLKKFQIKKFKIHFENIAIFSNENVIYLNPKINFDLLKLHKRFHEKFKKFIKGELKYYLPSNWIPHCTLAFEMNDEDFIESFKLVKNNFKPIDVTVKRIGFIKFRPIERLFLREINN